MKKAGPREYDWKPAPFGRARKVRPEEGRRWTNGISGREWPGEQTDLLLKLVDAGYGYDALARRLGRSRIAVELKCKRLGARVTTTPATLSARDVAVLLGKPCSKSVSRWIALGWLPARNAGGAGNKALWRVQWDDLLAFMERRTTWMAWDAGSVQGRALREWAQELRTAAGGEWIAIGDVAARYCIESAAVNRWVRRGYIPAVRYGNWWLWSADIDGWVMPSARSRKGLPRWTPYRLDGKAGLALR